jgi:uncharacterized Rossmann fold enzyme
MPENDFFDRNIRSLSLTNPSAASRLSGVQVRHAQYKIVEARSGERMPTAIDANGTAHALHSTMDPVREAKRLIDTADEGFIVLLGLGGGFYAEAALEREETGIVFVIEFNSESFAELISLLDYSRLFTNPRFRLLLDNSGLEIEEAILSLYQPVLSGGIRVIPLRPRTGLDPEAFTMAANAVEAAIGRVSADYSVQAHFGKRWFSNTVRNLMRLGENQETLPVIHRAAVCAAGPSLSMQFKRLKENREGLFLIATDTSLPCLLHAGIKPDAVISIDCQHISYHHFMNEERKKTVNHREHGGNTEDTEEDSKGFPEETLLFLDLASPPMLAAITEKKHFFTGGHPLTRYISQVCMPLPELDTSGGNVTYAAVSLAERLGAGEIELYGADFSYPHGVTYARGTYIYPIFESRQNRLLPLEAQASAFLYRTPLEKRKKHGGHGENHTWYYETGTMKNYRERLEEKCRHMEAALNPVEGLGAPISVRQGENQRRDTKAFSCGKSIMKAEDFLRFYREGIANLPEPEKNSGSYLALLSDGQRMVLTTLLPAAAAIKKRRSAVDFREVFEETRAFCLAEIDTILRSFQKEHH